MLRVDIRQLPGGLPAVVYPLLDGHCCPRVNTGAVPGPDQCSVGLLGQVGLGCTKYNAANAQTLS